MRNKLRRCVSYLALAGKCHLNFNIVIRRVAAFEVMVRTDAIAAKIRENKTFQIVSDIETGGARGMRTLDADLLALVANGSITAEEAMNHSQDAEMMRSRLKNDGKKA